MAKARLKRNAHRHAPAATAPLPRERTAEMGFVWSPDDGRLICPWPRGGLDWRDEPRLLTVLSLVDALKPTAACWLWPDPTRRPQPVEAPDVRRFISLWGETRASYVSRRRTA
jgi:hypothetical protein